VFSDGSQVSPVMLPPGRARDEIYPRPTGSRPYTMTIGTEVVACFAASMKRFGPVTITSTFRRSRSATALGTSSALYPDERVSRF